jgi:hypothetical protein
MGAKANAVLTHRLAFDGIYSSGKLRMGMNKE